MNASASTLAGLSKRYQNVLVPLLLIAGTLIFVVVPAWQLIVDGPFSWHISQPQFWQGGIEALTLIALLCGTQLLARPALRLALSVLIAEIYLRRYAVDASVVIDVAYFELAIGLGALLMRLAGTQKPHSVLGYLRCFVLGLCVWSACAWTASALGFGTLHDLRWLTLLLLPFALAARSRPWIAFVHERVARMPRAARVSAATLLGWMLVLFARSNVAFDYDALWYGLHGDFVLVGGGSVFASMGLTAPVHYYPKLYELFLIPLSGLGNSSVISGITLLILTLLAAAAWDLLRRLRVQSKALRFLAVNVCLTLPVVANIAIGPKPDILAAFLLIFAWIEGAQFIETRKTIALLWMFDLLLLATQAKLSAVPFAVALAIAVLWEWSRSGERSIHWAATSQPEERHLAATATCLVILVTAFVTSRTLLLAGVPTIGPEVLVKLWQFLGLHITPPAGTIQWSYPTDWAGIPQLATDLLFRPQRLSHIVITWIGNIWLWLALVALLVRPTRHDTVGEAKNGLAIAAFALMAVGFALMLCWGYRERGGDGNYFIVALIPAILMGFAAAHPVGNIGAASRYIFFACIITFCLFDATYSFASGAWIPGTRAWDLNFHGKFRALRTYNHDLLEANGAGEIARKLRSARGTPRVVGYMDDAIGFALPASYEGLWMVSFTHPEFIDDQTRFQTYLADNGIDFLIMPHADVSATKTHITPIMIQIVDEITSNSAVIVTKDKNYDLYDLSGVQGYPSAPLRN